MAKNGIFSNFKKLQNRFHVKSWHFHTEQCCQLFIFCDWNLSPCILLFSSTKAYGLTLGTQVEIQTLISDPRLLREKCKGRMHLDQPLKGRICQPNCLMDKALIKVFNQDLKISGGHFYGLVNCIKEVQDRDEPPDVILR